MGSGRALLEKVAVPRRDEPREDDGGRGEVNGGGGRLPEPETEPEGLYIVSGMIQ